MAFMVFFLSMVIDNFYIVWSIFFPHKTETGGVLGAYFVTMTIIAVPRLGTLAVMSIIIAGQLRDVENADLPFCRSVFQNAIAVIFNNAGHYSIRGRMPLLRK